MKSRTGVLDISGNEICVGDVITVPGSWAAAVLGEQFTAFVVANDGHVFVSDSNGYDINLILRRLRELNIEGVKIIGNIFENPALNPKGEQSY